MTEELRSLLRDELGAERPPPLGDLVGAAVRDGRRIRRRRRLAALGCGTAVAGVMAVAVALGGPYGAAPGPQPVPAASRVPDASPSPAGGARVPATPEAMLVLLRDLVPPGRSGDFAKGGGKDLRVQMSLDRGDGPGLIRVSVAGYPSVTGTGRPEVTVQEMPDTCTQSVVVRADWPGGLTVQADLSTCRPSGSGSTPSPLALTGEEATAVVSDPRWGAAMDPALVRAGEQEFPDLATFG